MLHLLLNILFHNNNENRAKNKDIMIIENNIINKKSELAELNERLKRIDKKSNINDKQQIIHLSKLAISKLRSNCESERVKEIVLKSHINNKMKILENNKEEDWYIPIDTKENLFDERI